MLLGTLFDDPALPPVEVTALAYDNRAVEPGTVFFAVRGFTRNGHEFAPDAVTRGAAALVVDHPLGLGVPEVVVPDVRAAMAPAAARLQGDPTAQLQVVGITGTNGKTTTAYLVRALLEAAGRPTGLLGTVAQIVGGREVAAVRTTPEAVDLQRTFREMLDAGDRCCAMEVSSHALELGRADAIHWSVAVFTNLSQDHLDFHPDMESYFRAKRRLFERTQGPRIVVVDDPWGARLADEFPMAITVGLERRADLQVRDGRLDGRPFEVPLPGRFNVLNALCAVAVARALGVDDDTSLAALPHARIAPGRFEPVDEGQDFTVVVDYAHTPEALANVLQTAADLAAGQVIAVFGAGGDRDRDKRPQMGAAAAAGADVVIVTSDNPRSEDPELIIADIVRGARNARAVVDRREAIEYAIGLAARGDVVVIAGKGHEQGQELAGGVKMPFDDVSVAREALRARLVA